MTENVVWDVVAFVPVPIFFLSCSPLRSLILGPCRELFNILVESLVSFFYLLVLFLLFFGGICMLCVVCVLCFPIFIIYLVYKGLIWIVKRLVSVLLNVNVIVGYAGINLSSISDLLSQLQHLLLIKFGSGKKLIAFQKAHQCMNNTHHQKSFWNNVCVKLIIRILRM